MAASATKIRLRFRLATGRVIRPGLWIGNALTNVGVTDSELQAVANAGRTSVSSSGLMAGFDDTVVFEESEAQNFERKPADGDHPRPFWEATTVTFESSGTDIAGTQSADSLPPQNAFVYAVLSAHPGPSGRNRMYGPPLVDSEVDSLGTIDAARVSQLQADIDAWRVACYTAATGSMLTVVASAEDDDLYTATNGILRTIVRSQRRRTV